VEDSKPELFVDALRSRESLFVVEGKGAAARKPEET
jgi:hypothetical protein